MLLILGVACVPELPKVVAIVLKPASEIEILRKDFGSIHHHNTCDVRSSPSSIYGESQYKYHAV